MSYHVSFSLLSTDALRLENKGDETGGLGQISYINDFGMPIESMSIDIVDAHEDDRIVYDGNSVHTLNPHSIRIVTGNPDKELSLVRFKGGDELDGNRSILIRLNRESFSTTLTRSSHVLYDTVIQAATLNGDTIMYGGISGSNGFVETCDLSGMTRNTSYNNMTKPITAMSGNFIGGDNFISKDLGENLSSAQNVSHLSRISDSLVLAVTGNGLFKFDGTNYTAVTVSIANNKLRKTFALPDGKYFVLSTDTTAAAYHNGTAFSYFTSAPVLNDLWSDGSETWAVGEKVYKSTNQSAWVEVEGYPATATWTNVFVHGGIVYITGTNSSNTVITAKYEDGQWSSVAHEVMKGPVVNMFYSQGLWIVTNDGAHKILTAYDRSSPVHLRTVHLDYDKSTPIWPIITVALAFVAIGMMFYAHNEGRRISDRRRRESDFEHTFKKMTFFTNQT